MAFLTNDAETAVSGLFQLMSPRPGMNFSDQQLNELRDAVTSCSVGKTGRFVSELRDAGTYVLFRPGSDIDLYLTYLEGLLDAARAAVLAEALDAIHVLLRCKTLLPNASHELREIRSSLHAKDIAAAARRLDATTSSDAGTPVLHDGPGGQRIGMDGPDTTALASLVRLVAKLRD